MTQIARLAVGACLVFAGCANWQPIPGHSPDMSWRDAAGPCIRAGFQAVPMDQASALGGAMGGIADASQNGSKRTEITRQCMASHGWQDLNDN